MPGAQLIAVVALADGARGGAKIVEVSLRARRQVFVVARRRPDTAFEGAPGRRVAGGELLAAAALIGVVAQRGHRAANGAHQFGSGLVAGAEAARDVAGRD